MEEEQKSFRRTKGCPMAGTRLASGKVVCLECFMSKDYVLREASEPLLDVEVTIKDVCIVCHKKIANIRL